MYTYFLFDIFLHASGLISPSCLEMVKQIGVCSSSLSLHSLKCARFLLVLVKRLRNLPQQSSMISLFTTQLFGVCFRYLCELVRYLIEECIYMYIGLITLCVHIYGKPPQIAFSGSLDKELFAWASRLSM